MIIARTCDIILQKKDTIKKGSDKTRQINKKICIIYTGGTIGMVPSEVGYVPSGHIKEMLNSIQDLKKPNMPEIEVIQFDPLLDSSNMAVKEWNLIGRTIRDNYDCFDGFVVLHGTDTMSYSVERPVKNGVSFNQASVNNCNILLIKPFRAKAVDVNHSHKITI